MFIINADMYCKGASRGKLPVFYVAVFLQIASRFNIASNALIGDVMSVSKCSTMVMYIVSWFIRKYL
jgi:hypothetical protein